MRLLFIEDEPASVEPAIRRLKNDGHACNIKTFSEALTAIDEIIPDIVILDLLENGASPEPENPGLSTYDYIWEKRFCPIVIYSAHPELLTAEVHPFVERVQKGLGSVTELVEKIGVLRPQVDAIREAETQIQKEFAYALREVAPHAFKLFSDAGKRNDLILRSGRRRLAALMDNFARHGESLVSWEKYICPPVSNDIMLGDIIQEIGRPFEDPTVFRIVLTPSCDLVSTPKRNPKAKNVLVARCCGVKEGFRLTSLGDIGAAKIEPRLSGILSQGYFEAIMIFPEYTGKIPHMVANLKDLELIPINQLVNGERRYERVASIDSPFRELVAWAYMQIACRPGLPDRDFDGWKTEIIKSCWNSGKSVEPA